MYLSTLQHEHDAALDWLSYQGSIAPVSPTKLEVE